MVGGADGLAHDLGVRDLTRLRFDAAVPEFHVGFAGKRSGRARASVGENGLEQQGAGFVFLRSGQLPLYAAGERRAGLAFLKREHPAEHDGDLILGVLRVGQHWDLPPDAAAAETHLFVEEIVRARLLAVLVGDVHEGRPDQRGLHGVAVEAIALAHQR